MFVKEVKLQFRDAKNRITGKQAAIDEYNALTLQICYISDRLANDNPLKKTIIENINRICEKKCCDGPYGSFFIDSYNPWASSKSTTNKKITALQELLGKINRAGISAQR